MGLQFFESKLSEDIFSVDELRDMVNDLKLSCDDSVGILNQLLMYDKIDSGLATLDKTKFLVLPFLEAAMKSFHLQVYSRTKYF